MKTSHALLLVSLLTASAACVTPVTSDEDIEQIASAADAADAADGCENGDCPDPIDWLDDDDDRGICEHTHPTQPTAADVANCIAEAEADCQERQDALEAEAYIRLFLNKIRCELSGDCEFAAEPPITGSCHENLQSCHWVDGNGDLWVLANQGHQFTKWGPSNEDPNTLYCDTRPPLVALGKMLCTPKICAWLSDIWE